MAESGRFNLSGYTPIHSAMKADSYEVFFWLSYNKTTNEIMNEAGDKG